MHWLPWILQLQYLGNLTAPMSVAVLARSLLWRVLELFWKPHLVEADKKSRIYSVLQTSQSLLFVSSGQPPRTDPYSLFFSCFWISEFLGWVNFSFFSHKNFLMFKLFGELFDTMRPKRWMHTCTSGKLPSVKLTLSLDFRINGGLGMRGLGRVRELVSRLWVTMRERLGWFVWRFGMMREGLGWPGMVRERVGRLGMVREAMAGLVRGASWLLALGSRSSVDAHCGFHLRWLVT